MSALLLGLVVVTLAATCLLTVEVLDRRRIRRAHHAKVGLDLVGLVTLLPAHLRTRRYERYRIAYRRGPCISIALIYDGGIMYRGNPPNVGLDFDATTGALVGIHEDGIGLGIK